MAYMNNPQRAGNFTSSKIYKLLKEGKKKGSWGAPALTYIEEKQIERRMGRCIDTGADSYDIRWGEFLELIVFNKLGMDYVITSLDTDVHPKIPFWAGSKDFHKMKNGKPYCIGDIKCFQPKKFAQYADCLMKQDVELLKKDFETEYWQLVSNAVINNCRYAEAVLYMPYESDFDEIREIAAGYEGPDQYKWRFIYESPVSELAVLPDGGYYKDLNRFEFKVPAEDVKLLTEKVLAAGKLLTAGSEENSKEII